MMDARFVLTPFYEIVDTIVPFTRLVVDESEPCDFPERVSGRQIVEFNIPYEHNLLIKESKRQKDVSFNLRAVLRLCKFDDVRTDQYGVVVKDSFPLHLFVDLNNTIVPLPHMLPNDRYGKDGRRFSRPIDLLDGLIENSTDNNRLTICWAQDKYKEDQYFCAVYLVRLRACSELTGLLLARHVARVASSLSLIYDHCGDPDGDCNEDLLLVNTSITISLNCPVSHGRIKIPIRGQSCNHLQCFDFITYLVLNFKKPIWQCPICDKATFFCNLEVDGLIFHILKDERSTSVDYIQFNKSGQWRPQINGLEDASDDRAYFDISDFIRLSLSDSNDKVNTSSESLKENLNEYSIEKYLKLVLNISSVGGPDNDLTGDMKPTTPTTDNSCLAEDQKTLSTVCSTASLPSPSLLDDKDGLRLNLPDISSSNSSPAPFLGPIRGEYLSLLANCETAKLEIINVVSMADRKGKHKDLQVVPAATKRPSAVSSVPTELHSYKKMKLIDSKIPQFPRPQSASMYDHYPAHSVTHVCKCSPGLGCPLHADPLQSLKALSANPVPMDVYSQYSNMDAVTQPMAPTNARGACNFFQRQYSSPSQPPAARNVPTHHAMLPSTCHYVPATDPIIHDSLAYPCPSQQTMAPRSQQSYIPGPNPSMLLPHPFHNSSAPHTINMHPEPVGTGARYENSSYPPHWGLGPTLSGPSVPVGMYPLTQTYSPDYWPRTMDPWQQSHQVSPMPPMYPYPRFYNSPYCNASFN